MVMSRSELTIPPAPCAQVSASFGMGLPTSEGAPGMSKYPVGILVTSAWRVRGGE